MPCKELYALSHLWEEPSNWCLMQIDCESDMWRRILSFPWVNSLFHFRWWKDIAVVISLSIMHVVSHIKLRNSATRNGPNWHHRTSVGRPSYQRPFDCKLHRWQSTSNTRAMWKPNVSPSNYCNGMIATVGASEIFMCTARARDERYGWHLFGWKNFDNGVSLAGMIQLECFWCRCGLLYIGCWIIEYVVFDGKNWVDRTGDKSCGAWSARMWCQNAS